MFALYALNLPLALAFMVPSFWLALQGKPFKVAVVGSALVIGVSAAVAFGQWPQVSEALSLRDKVFEVQLLTLLAVLPAYPIAISIANLARSQAQIAKSNMQFSVTLGNMNQGVSCFDADDRLTVWNEKFAQMFNMKKADLYAGVSFYTLLEIQRESGNFVGVATQLRNSIVDTLQAGKEYVAETVLSDGRIIKSVHSPTPLVGGLRRTKTSRTSGFWKSVWPSNRHMTL